MFDYTYKNHFRVGYDGEWFNLPDDYHEEMQVDYGQCPHMPASFSEEWPVASHPPRKPMCPRTKKLGQSKMRSAP